MTAKLGSRRPRLRREGRQRFADSSIRKLGRVDKRVVAVLRNGSRVESEPMVEQEARHEVTRIHEQAEAGRTNRFVKLGNSAIFNLEDLDRIAIEDASVDQ